MRPLDYFVLWAGVAASLAGGAGAQESIGSPPAAASQTELEAGDIRASNLLGATVKRLTGDSIGNVEDLIVSGDADIRLAVISVGGVLGVGGKTIAIPFDEFMVAPDGSTLYLTMSEEELSARPAFDLDNLNNVARPEADDRPGAAEQPRSELRDSADAPLAAPDGSAAAHLAHSAQFRGDGASKSKATRQPASALIGAEVRDAEQMQVGKVSDLIVTAEPPDVQVIVELNEPLGSRLVAVPLPDLTILRDDMHRDIERVETSLTLAELGALPRYVQQGEPD